MKRRGRRRIFGFLRWAALLTLACAIALALDFFTGYEVHRSVSYGEDESNVMDIFLPRGSEDGIKGCVLFIHGGSWSGGDKSEEEMRCRLLASRGYMAATVNYTLRDGENPEEYTVFTVLDEIEAAIYEARDFAALRGISLTRVALSGYSAGAHIAMLYAYSRWNTSPLEIAFVSSMAGPSDISDEAWGEDTAEKIGGWLTGTDLGDNSLDVSTKEHLLSSVSPISYVSASSPPTLIIHGGRDSTVPIANAESLISALESAEVPYEYVYLEDSDHSLLGNPIKHLSFYGLILDYCRDFGFCE